METYGPFDEALARLRRLLPHIRPRTASWRSWATTTAWKSWTPAKRRDHLPGERFRRHREGRHEALVRRRDDLTIINATTWTGPSRTCPAGHSYLLAHSNEIYEGSGRLRTAALPLRTQATQCRYRYSPSAPYSPTVRPRGAFVRAFGITTAWRDSPPERRVSGVPVRFSCRGEVAYITLRRKLERLIDYVN